MSRRNECSRLERYETRDEATNAAAQREQEEGLHPHSLKVARCGGCGRWHAQTTSLATRSNRALR